MANSHLNPNQGLTIEQVMDRINHHQVNYHPKSLTRSVGAIVWGNTFTLFNIVNLALGALVFYTGSYKNLLFLIIAIANTIIGTFQEIRSKHRIDQMALLSQGRIMVCRNSKIERLLPSQIVKDDVIILRLGDQVPVDGKIIQTRALEVNESQITGEPDTINKEDGDPIVSGSVVISGSARMVATKVGSKAFVNQLSNQARTSHEKSSKLLNIIKTIIRILTYVIVPLGIALFSSKIIQGLSTNKAILGTVAAMIGMIPEGLVLLSSVTLAVSAMKLARHHVLVRSLPAIETLARADVLCLDKTGTITTGRLKMRHVIPLGNYRVDEIKKALGTMIHAIDDTDSTAEALKLQLNSTHEIAQKVVPFSSIRKWSGAEFKSGNYILGAPQWISQLSPELKTKIEHYAHQGYRVVGFAKTTRPITKAVGHAHMIALILITDIIRPNARRIFKYFVKQGVRLNVISGDDPVTASSVAYQAGIPNSDKLIDMSTVRPDQDYRWIVKHYQVFGRVKPEQKQRLIKALQEDGHTVGMTGDGVNDILALKQADCGIAMATGSESTKSIANFVLMHSDFAAMANVLGEGRRVTNNVANVASLYLIKTMYSLALTCLFIFASRDYPFQPIQLTPISTFMIGIPTFFLALEPNYDRISHQFTEKIVKVAVPAAITIIAYILLDEMISKILTLPYFEASSINVILTGTICWLALIKVSKPLSRFKLMIIIATAIFFTLTFLVWGHLFNLYEIYEFHEPLLVIGMAITTYPALILVQSVVKMIYRIFWHSSRRR